MNGEAMSSPKVSKKLIEGGSKTKYVKAAPDKNPNRLKGAKKYTYFPLIQYLIKLLYNISEYEFTCYITYIVRGLIRQI